MSEILVEIANKANRVASIYAERAGRRLDFSEESMAVVEEMLSEAALYREQLSDGQLLALTHEIGCYILEVARRRYGGKYYWYEPSNAPVLVIGEPHFKVAIMTFEKVKGRLSGETADNIPFFFEGFLKRLQNARAGDDVLYL